MKVLITFIIFCVATTAQAGPPAEISVPKKLAKKLRSFEPSAALYLADNNLYLIASDDTDSDDSAMLFLMNANGEVETNPVMLDGIEAMTDIESLSSDGRFVYALSSQSRNKKGKELSERNLFVRSEVVGGELKNNESIELRPLLLSALAQASDPVLIQLRPQFDRLLEAEASYVRDGKLYVGLKDPQPRPGVGLVLELGNVDQIFLNRKLNSNSLRVAYEIDFGGVDKISEIIVAEQGFLIASTKETGGGSIWSLNNGTTGPTLINSYSSEKPEGLSLGRNPSEVLIVFDQGSEKALFAHERFK